MPVLFFVKVAEGFRCKDVIRHFEKEYFFNSAISISGELDLIINIDFDDAKEVSQAHEALSQLEEVAMVKTNLVVNIFT
nr:hypothetical protein [Psychrobacter sp. PraFG1]UNK04568.1 hypothetical protein MN210_09805 [Psychrobacter sp. PraFG1]